jgi:hypothetical protein
MKGFFICRDGLYRHTCKFYHTGPKRDRVRNQSNPTIMLKRAAGSNYMSTQHPANYFFKMPICQYLMPFGLDFLLNTLYNI